LNSNSDSPLQDTSVLVVDDSESVQTLCRNVLEESDYLVVGVTSGGAALSWLQDHAASLVLLDYRLPDMTGLDLLRELSAQGRKIPFVAITAHGDERIAVEMMKQGALDYLAKDNVFADMLPGVVHQALDYLQKGVRLAAAEQVARERDGRFRAIFENAAAGMATVSPGGNILEVNPAVCRFLGYAAEELQAVDVASISHPDDREITQRLYAELERRERSAFSYEKRYFRKDGSVVWGLTTVAGVYGDDGRLGYSVVLLQDITARKLYEDFVAVVDRGATIKNGDGFFRSLGLYLSEALCADYVIVGELVPEDRCRIRTIVTVVDGSIGENLAYMLRATPCENVVEQAVTSYPERVQELFPHDPHLAEMGAQAYVGTPLLDAKGKALGILAVIFRRPVTNVRIAESILQFFAVRAASELERRQGEVALRQSEQNYRLLSEEFQALLDGIPDLLLLLTPERKVVWANRAALQRLGEQAPAVEERFCYHFCANGKSSCDVCPVKRCFDGGTPDNSILKHPDGTLWGVKTFPLHGEAGQVDRLIMLASDITEKVRLREEAERSGRLAAVGELAAGVAHEINNPTGLILMNMPVIKAAFDDARPILEEHYRDAGDFIFGGLKYSKMKGQMPHLLDEILDGAQRIRSIVEDMKSFSRGGKETEFSPFDLNAAVQRAVRLVGNQIRNATDRFSCRSADDLPLVKGSPQRIEQVLVNLILNACQALPGKERALEVVTRFSAKNRLCQVVVRDEGVGVSEKDMAHLTDPFFTTRRENGGTGLGLSVSARIVRDHGGSLQFSSTPGEGTTVTLSLPAYCEEAEG